MYKSKSPESWNQLDKPSSASHGVKSKPSEVGDSLPPNSDDLYLNMETFPLLSPQMESELMKEFSPFPPKLSATEKRKDSSSLIFWEEEFQDLSNWCAGNQYPDHCRTNPTYRQHQDYHIGEQAIPKEFEIGNYDYLSIKSEGSTEIQRIDKDSRADCSIRSLEMSLQDSQLDHYETSNILDVWFNLPSTEMTNEQRITKNVDVMSNKAENVFDNNFDLLNEPIDMWLTNTQDIPSQNLLPNSNCINISEECHSTSTNIIDDTILNTNTRQRDSLCVVDVASKPFDLLSYMCDDEVNLPENTINKGATEVGSPDTTLVTSSTIPETIFSDVSQISSTECSTVTKVRRQKKSTQQRVKSQPYSQPLKITKRKQSATIDKNLPSHSGKFEYQSDSESRTDDGFHADEESRTACDSDSQEYNYRELREKNNKASRKSRINKKTKEAEMMNKAASLERDNRILKMKVQELDKLVTTMRAALLQSALKKET